MLRGLVVALFWGWIGWGEHKSGQKFNPAHFSDYEEQREVGERERTISAQTTGGNRGRKQKYGVANGVC